MIPVDCVTLPIKVAKLQHLADLTQLKRLLCERDPRQINSEAIKKFQIESQRHYQERKNLYKAAAQGAKIIDTYVDKQGTQFYSGDVLAPVRVDRDKKRPGNTSAADHVARFMLAQYAAFKYKRGTQQFENAKKMTGMDLSEAAALAHEAQDNPGRNPVFWEAITKWGEENIETHDQLTAAQLTLFTIPDAAQLYGYMGASVFQTPQCDPHTNKYSKYEIADFGMFRCYCPACAIQNIRNSAVFNARDPPQSMVRCVVCGLQICCDKFYIIKENGFICDECYAKYFNHDPNAKHTVFLR